MFGQAGAESHGEPQDVEGRALREMTKMLSRYPHLDDAERRYLAKLMRTAPIMDVALLSGDRDVGEAYRRFRSECASLFRPTLWESAKFAAFWAVPTIAVIWGIIALR